MRALIALAVVALAVIGAILHPLAMILGAMPFDPRGLVLFGTGGPVPADPSIELRTYRTQCSQQSPGLVLVGRQRQAPQQLTDSATRGESHRGCQRSEAGHAVGLVDLIAEGQPGPPRPRRRPPLLADRLASPATPRTHPNPATLRDHKG